MSRQLPKAGAPLRTPSTLPATPAVPVEDLDGPLCALSLYLSVAEGLVQAPDLDRDKLCRALEGARGQVAELARRTAAAVRAGSVS